MADSELDSFKALAASKGLRLNDEDAVKLRKSVEANRETGEKLRTLVAPEIEPGPVFSAAPISAAEG